MEIKNGIILLILTCCLIFLISLLFVPNFRGLLFERGSITGTFISGGHFGYGDSCGEYPGSYLIMSNCYPVPTIVKDFFWRDDTTVQHFYFENDYSGIDNLKVDNEYKINYHREYRPSDVSVSEQVSYWVIDSIEG